MSGFIALPKSSISGMLNIALDKFVSRVAPELQDGRRIVIVHPAAVREWAIKLGMDGSRFPHAATVATAYLRALEGTNTGEAVFVEGIGHCEVSTRHISYSASGQVILYQPACLWLQ
jgi:hypothetical protein